MKVLLDTHVWIWWLLGSDRLSPPERRLKQELEALLPRPVDLVRLRERMNPALRQAILQEGVTA